MDSMLNHVRRALDRVRQRLSVYLNRAAVSGLQQYNGQPLSSKFGLHKTVKARFWTGLEPFSGRGL